MILICRDCGSASWMNSRGQSSSNIHEGLWTSEKNQDSGRIWRKVSIFITKFYESFSFYSRCAIPDKEKLLVQISVLNIEEIEEKKYRHSFLHAG